MNIIAGDALQGWGVFRDQFVRLLASISVEAPSQPDIRLSLWPGVRGTSAHVRQKIQDVGESYSLELKQSMGKGDFWSVFGGTQEGGSMRVLASGQPRETGSERPVQHPPGTPVGRERDVDFIFQALDYLCFLATSRMFSVTDFTLRAFSSLRAWRGGGQHLKDAPSME